MPTFLSTFPCNNNVEITIIEAMNVKVIAVVASCPARAMLRELKIIGQKHVSEKVDVGDDESLRIIIFSKALNNLLKHKKYQKLFRNIELE